MQPPERSFIERFHDNDPTAWEEIFKAYYNNLIFFALRYPIDPNDREDIVIDAFGGLYRNRSRIEHKDDILAYLAVSVRRGCLKNINNQTKTGIRRKELPFVLDFQAANTEHQKWIYDIIDQIKPLIEKLPEQEKEVLQYSLNNLPPKEIAEKLGIDVPAVYTKRSRAIKRLRLLIIRSNLKLDIKRLALIILLFTNVLP